MAKKNNVRAKIRAPLSKERVLQAAIRLADKIGIASLSMRRLGQELGVEAMSLYKHVANKDDVLDGIVDIVASEIELPSIGGDWKKPMRRRASSAHEILLRQHVVAMETAGATLARHHPHPVESVISTISVIATVLDVVPDTHHDRQKFISD